MQKRCVYFIDIIISNNQHHITRLAAQNKVDREIFMNRLHAATERRFVHNVIMYQSEIMEQLNSGAAACHASA